MSATAGVAVMVGLADMVITVRDVLVLIGLALFLAIGLEPAVSLLARHKFPRWSAVLIVLVAGLSVVGEFLAAAVPPLAHTMFARLQSHNSLLTASPRTTCWSRGSSGGC